MRKILLVALASGLLLTGFASAAAQAQEGEPVKTGTDPRDFSPKFMPYYRYTDLENGLTQKDFVLFGMIAFTDNVAMTYELPIAQFRSVDETDLFDPATGLCAGAIPGGGATLPSGETWEGDCAANGMGDMNLRLMANVPGTFLGGNLMLGAQFDLPTGTRSELAGESFNIAPMVAYVHDIPIWPGPGAFFALMNFYFFDAWQDEGVDEVSMYVGRYFFMLPLNPKPFSGIYLLPEIQFIYDFENEHSSLWIAPEFGTMLSPGNILYGKPGWGIGADPQDRHFTFELGYRFFFQ